MVIVIVFMLVPEFIKIAGIHKEAPLRHCAAPEAYTIELTSRMVETVFARLNAVSTMFCGGRELLRPLLRHHLILGAPSLDPLGAYLFATVILSCAAVCVELLLFLYSCMDARLKGGSDAIPHVNNCAPPVNALPALSIMVPAYKEGERLLESLRSLSELDYPRDKLQILLVLEPDDIETIELLKKVGMNSVAEAGVSDSLWKGVRVTMVFNRSGLKSKPAALNYALRYARGEIIGVCDADDIFDPQIAVAAVSILRESGVAAVQFARHVRSPEGNRRSLLARAQEVEFELLNNYIAPTIAKVSGASPLLGSGYFIHRRVLEDVAFWNPQAPAEDLELSVRLISKSYRIAFVKAPLVHTLATTTLRELLRQRERWIRGCLLVAGKVLRCVHRAWPYLFIHVLLPMTNFFGASWALLSLFVPNLPAPWLTLLPLLLLITSYLLKILLHGKEAAFVAVVIGANGLAGWLTVWRLIKSPYAWTKTRSRD